MRIRQMLLAPAFLALGLGAGAPALGQQELTGKVQIDGSSTVYPITEAVAEEFYRVAPRVRVPVGVSGTGGGFKRFVKGETDISDASRPITPEEAAAAAESGVEFIELPVAYDGLTFVVNVNNHWAQDLTVDELKRIFLADSDVKRWSDIREEWPDRPLNLYAPGTDSGTFDYFKEVIAGDSGSIRDDLSVSEDDNALVRGVEGDENALGFFGVAYYLENRERLRSLAIDGGEGFVKPDHDTIESGRYAPFSRPLFIYVNKTSSEREEVRAFVTFYLLNAPELVEDVGYVRLPPAIMNTVKQKWANRQTGSHFIDDRGEKKHGPLAAVYQ